MRTIWKFSSPVTDEFTVAMPKGAEILSVQVQAGVPRMWALVDPDAEPARRTFRWFGTGHPVLPAALKYVGTLQSPGGHLVFHLFEDLGEARAGA